MTGPALDAPGASSAFGIIIAFLILATLAVCLRFVAIRQRKAEIALSDWAIVAALGFMIIDHGLALYVVLHGGLGYPLVDVSPDQLIVFAKYTSISQFFYILAVAFGRASVILFMLKIFYPVRWFKFAGYTILAIHTVWFIYSFIIVAVVCVPFDKQWRPDIPGTCRDLKNSITSFAYWAIANEVLIWALPLPVLWTLKMRDPRQKIGLTLIFLVGLITIGVSIARVIGNNRIDPTNITADGALALQLAVVEPAIIIIVACLPVYWVLLDKLLAAMAELYSGIVSRISQSGGSARGLPPNDRSSSEQVQNIELQQTKADSDGSGAGKRGSTIGPATIRVDREISVTASHPPAGRQASS